MEISAIEMDSIVTQLGRWISLMQQVHEAQHFIERTEKIAHPENFQTLDGLLEILVYFRGALNSYGKCFISTGHGKKSLDAERVFGDDRDLLERHIRIMELRHKYVAHSDHNEIERTALAITDTPAELRVRFQYNLSFSFDRMYELRGLIKHLTDHVVDAQKKHILGIEQKVAKPVLVQQGN
jgi:hypothetical protein